MLDELIEHRIDVILRALEISAEEQFSKQGLVMQRENALDRLHAVMARELAQQLDLQPGLPP